jgi:hypothetical protein
MNNIPAFPRPFSAREVHDGIEHHLATEGMTLRDYFAAKAMQALIAKIPLHDRLGEHGIHTPEVEDIHGVRQDIAQSAYDYADAMLAERLQERA